MTAVQALLWDQGVTDMLRSKCCRVGERDSGRGKVQKERRAFLTDESGQEIELVVARMS